MVNVIHIVKGANDPVTSSTCQLRTHTQSTERSEVKDPNQRNVNKCGTTGLT